MPQFPPIVPVILSGGSGTRLWPMSTPDLPKQMLALTATETMLQLTALRVLGALRADGERGGERGGERFAAPIVVANARHAEQVEAQLADVGASAQALILEPVGRNTAPAIALAALASLGASLGASIGASVGASEGAGAGDAPLLVMPSDHVITDVAAFHAAIHAALPLVRDGWLVTFGIDPNTPETGYGWIHVGEEIAGGVHRVASFVEKPPRDAAEAMLAAGDHAWNGGIFLFRADTYLAALALHDPDILVACRKAMDGARHAGARVYPDAGAFAAAPSDSIDYAVMEKAARVAVVPVRMGWSDLGSWDALHEISDRDGAGNAHAASGGGEVIAIDTANCLVRSDGARVALVGVADLIVVASGNDILILPRGRSQDVKRLIEEMKAREPKA